jgi:hypothetical protein
MTVSLKGRMDAFSIATCLTISFAAAQISHAETLATVNQTYFDCTHEVAIGSSPGDFLKKNINFNNFINEVTDKRRKKYALKAAENALNAGYNYAYMIPMRVDDRRFMQETSGFGFTFNIVGGRQYKMLECAAVDDVMAYELTQGAETLKRKNSAVASLVDLRQMVQDFSGQAYKKPQSPQISARHLTEIGAREKIARQYPVMQAALECTQSLRPKSISDFSSDITPEARANEEACLTSLKPQALSVGLSFRTLNEVTSATSGYVLNQPLSGGSATGSTPFVSGGNKYARLMDEDVWGRDWLDNTAMFPNFDGKVLYNPDRRLVLVGSNIRQGTDLLDYAVYTAAKNNLDSGKEGIKFDNRLDPGSVFIEYKRKRDYQDRQGNSGIRLTEVTDIRHIEKAEFNVFDDYKNVSYFKISTTGSKKGFDKCIQTYLLCADILNAYNTLGVKLGAEDFSPLTTPAGYRPYRSVPYNTKK